jgi:hypothetical protein
VIVFPALRTKYRPWPSSSWTATAIVPDGAPVNHVVGHPGDVGNQHRRGVEQTGMRACRSMGFAWQCAAGCVERYSRQIHFADQRLVTRMRRQISTPICKSNYRERFALVHGLVEERVG